MVCGVGAFLVVNPLLQRLADDVVAQVYSPVSTAFVVGIASGQVEGRRWFQRLP